MSFILDALKKSENERARQKGPALLEARVVAQRRGVPAWAIVIAGVLVANLVVLTLVVLRRPQAAPVVAVPAPAVAPPPVVVQVPVPMAQAPAPVAAQPTAPPPDVYVPPGANYVPPNALPPDEAPAAASTVNPADYQPARPAYPRASAPAPALTSPASAPAPSPASPADAALPLGSDLAGSGLPEQRLTLHIYDDRPSVRMILLNSQKLLEGDTSPEGVRVERITPDGAVLSWRGQRFRVQPGG